MAEVRGCSCRGEVAALKLSPGESAGPEDEAVVELKRKRRDQALETKACALHIGLRGRLPLSDSQRH